MSNNKVLPPSCLFIALATMVLLHFFIPVYRLIPYPWNAAGLVLLAVGIALNISADRTFTAHGTTVKPFEESSTLVTSGVFSYSRNPMYLGMVLMLTGVAVLLGAASPFIIIPVFAITLNRLFITAEESMLAKRFPDTWKQYSSRVRRWL